MSTGIRAPSGAHRRLPGDERRREIVAAVLALARERGPEAITTQAIAARMGLTQGALFRHFPDKDAVWLAVFDWIRSSLEALFAAATLTAHTPLAKVEQVFLGHVKFIVANPGVPRVVFHELQYPGDSPVRKHVRAMVDAYRQQLRRLFAQAKRAGELAQDVDVALAPVLFIGAIQGLVIESSMAGGETAMMARARRMWPLLLDGLRYRRP